MISDEQSKAVTEVARTTGEIVKAAGGLGSYLARVLGSIPEDALGIIGGDWLQHKRRRHIAALAANTQRKLEGVAQERLSEPSPSVLIPLLQAAVDEGRTELQKLWAALLANAMLDGGLKVRRDYFETVRQMEPIDALYFRAISRIPYPSKNPHEPGDFVELETAEPNIDPTERQISEQKLLSLKVIYEVSRSTFRLSAFGRGLLAAISIEDTRA